MTNIMDFSPHADGVTDDTTAIQAALAAADAAHDFVYFPAGVYAIAGSLSLSGHYSAIHGAGALRTNAPSGGAPQGTVFKAISQTGPVLDFTGFKFPDSHRGRMTFGGFTVQGDNTAGIAKSGIYIPSSESVNFTDIAIEQTGGPGLDLGRAYLSDFNRITIVTPVNAAADDIPYLRATATNGCRFIGVGFRSMTPVVDSSGHALTTIPADVGLSGALIVRESSAYEPEANHWLGCWFENLHLQDNSTLILHRGGLSILDGFEFFDCARATPIAPNDSNGGTAFIRFQGPQHLNVSTGTMDEMLTGGNQLRGLIPGRGTSANSIDVGVDMQQGRNSVQGVKGFKGGNVMLASGVGMTTVFLGGSQSQATTPGASNAAVIDNSGLLTNTIIDLFAGLVQLPQAGNYNFGTDAGLKRVAAGTVNVGKLSVSNANTASSLGTVVRKIQVFDAAGASLGYLPVVTESS